MLKVWFGHDAPFKFVRGANHMVADVIKPEAFRDPFIQNMIKDIDSIKTDSEGRMYHPIFGAINQSMLSAGVSGLILAYLTDYPTDITRMGDNCMPWLIKIAENKDITCVCNRIPIFDQDFTFQDLKTGEIYHTRERFAARAFHSAVEEMKQRDEQG